MVSVAPSMRFMAASLLACAGFGTGFIADLGPARAQGEPVGEVFVEPWRMQCRNVEDFGEVCEVSYSIFLSENEEIPAFSLGVRARTDIDGPAVFFVKAPLRILLKEGVVFKIDKGRTISYGYNHCEESGCYVIERWNQEVIDAIIRGSDMEVTFYAIDGKAQSIPVSLAGTAKAFKALADKRKG